MRIESHIAHGCGPLFPTTARSAEVARNLRGEILLIMSERWHVARQFPRVTARPEKSNGIAYYAVDIDGIPGRMVENKSKSNQHDPDFLGLLGRGDELMIRGWKHPTPDGDQYIWLEFVPCVREPEQGNMTELQVLEV